MAAITVTCCKYIQTELPSQDSVDPICKFDFAPNNSHHHSLSIWNNNRSSSIIIFIPIKTRFV
ncbi:hypothetical protein Hanom_Chr09g00802461 [Helianthus anomalus]